MEQLPKNTVGCDDETHESILIGDQYVRMNSNNYCSDYLRLEYKISKDRTIQDIADRLCAVLSCKLVTITDEEFVLKHIYTGKCLVFTLVTGTEKEYIELIQCICAGLEDMCMLIHKNNTVEELVRKILEKD